MSTIDVKPEGYNTGFEKVHHDSLPQQERTPAYAYIAICLASEKEPEAFPSKKEPEALKKLTKTERKVAIYEFFKGRKLEELIKDKRVKEIIFDDMREGDDGALEIIVKEDDSGKEINDSKNQIPKRIFKIYPDGSCLEIEFDPEDGAVLKETKFLGIVPLCIVVERIQEGDGVEKVKRSLYLCPKKIIGNDQSSKE